MKILHVAKKYLDILAGDSIVVSNLEKQQRANGNSVVILTSNCDEIKNGKSIYKFGLKDTPAGLDNITPKRLVSLVFLFFKAFKILKIERPDIIHTHSVDMAFAISFAARRYRIPLVHTFHIVTFNDPKQSAVRRKSELLFLRGARPSRFFVLDPQLVQDFANVGFPQAIFMPNGVDRDEWTKTRQQRKHDVYTFIAIGRIEEQKGFTYLVQAALTLLEAQDKFQIQIIGEGSLSESLQEQIEKAGLSKHVFLLGRCEQAEVRRLLASAQCFVLPSLWEAFPIVLLEAWASGILTIATKVGAIPAICTKASALLVRPGNAAELTKNMQLAMRGEFADSINNNLNLIKQQYNWKSINGQLEKLYDGQTDS